MNKRCEEGDLKTLRGVLADPSASDSRGIDTERASSGGESRPVRATTVALSIGSLFSGAGLADVGLERAGWTIKWQVEVDDYATSILEKHWPDVERYRDIRDVPRFMLPRVDAIFGGFPCVDISRARTSGKRRGLDGESSGLWSEYLRIVRGVRPRIVIVENVARGVGWLPMVRLELHVAGYATLPVRVCASDFGAPHRRERVIVFALANTDREGESACALHAQVERLPTIAALCRRDWGRPPAGALGVADGTTDWFYKNRLRVVGNGVCVPLAEFAGRVARDLLEAA